jgi:CDP-glycerol glycerophosphotransferase (TagB/SpsB family)
MFSQNVYLPAVYDLHRCCRVERNLIVFADAHHDGRPEAMELLYRRLKQSRVQPAYHIVEMYLDFGRASKAEVMEYSTRFMKLYARASVVVVCDNFLPAASCRKKRETMVVQLWHACGCYKKFGYDAKDDIPEGYHGDVYRNLSLVTVSAEAAVEPFSSAMHRTHGEVQALGVSRTDLYFSRKWRYRCIETFRELYPDVYEETGAESGGEADAGSGRRDRTLEAEGRQESRAAERQAA